MLMDGQYMKMNLIKKLDMSVINTAVRFIKNQRMVVKLGLNLDMTKIIS